MKEIGQDPSQASYTHLIFTTLSILYPSHLLKCKIS